MRTLQIAVDESFDDLRASTGAFALAGYASTPERWENFKEHWQVGCDKYLEGKPFKMSDLGSRPIDEREKIVEYFYNIIVEYAEFSFTFTIDQALHKEVFTDTRVLYWENIYYFLFYNTLFELLRDKDFTKGASLQFFFDAGWESKIGDESVLDFMAKMPPQVTSRLVSKPEFMTDGQFSPIQAADMKAWFSRKRYKEIFQGGEETPRLRTIREHLQMLPGRHKAFTRDELIAFRDSLVKSNLLQPKQAG
ncbi:MAG: hypothetical protein PGN12_16540 [Sphingomonas phyllosphaerae]